jgi:hypothetical protein
MKIYIGVNSDGSEIISKQPLKRFFDADTNREDVFSYNDTKKPPHWILDYAGISLSKFGDAPIDKYFTLPSGAIEKMFGISLTWEDDSKVVEL